MSDLIETTPQMDVVTQDIEHLVEELRAYHSNSRRSEKPSNHADLPGGFS